ncbi:hypothetical protein [Hydrogenophaga sp.]|uniref:hypothetical protein n=1 Tax=Hydrogenophaga sp. TaxID=1904254 RepID=UPI003D1530F6
MKSSTPLIETFARHLVPVYLELRNSDGSSLPFLFSAFAVQVRGNWLLVTAGHCLQKVGALRNQGWSIERARLIDALSIASKYSDPVPFDYDAALPTVPLDGELMDYGLLILGDLEAAQLEANGVVPLDEGAWPDDQVRPELFFVCGVPDHGAQLATNQVRLKAISALLKSLDTCPAELEEHPLRCYFEVVPTDQLPSMVGISGGPIFAARFVEGSMKYWIWGIQSSQAGAFPMKPYIAANLVAPLVRFLGEVADGQHADLLG